MTLNLLAFYLSFPYIYGGGESEKEGGKSHGGSLYSFLAENFWSFVNHYKVKKWWFYMSEFFKLSDLLGFPERKDDDGSFKKLAARVMFLLKYVW